MKITKFFTISFFIYAVIIFLIFRTWFYSYPLTGGDWEYFYKDSLASLSFFPSSWNSIFGNGFGGNQTFFMVPNTFFIFTAFILNKAGLQWTGIERLVWFYPYLLISTCSSFFLFNTVFKNKYKTAYGFFASFLYVCNTYALMIVGGGQMGVGMAYALLPLVIATFIRLSQLQEKRYILSSSLFFSLATAFLLLFDLRVFYISFVIIGIYSVFFIFPHWIKKRKFLKEIIFFYILPLTLILLLHSWWITAFLTSSQNPIANLTNNYLESDMLSFFSFANFSDAFSLLQPNWPENIFGKVTFLRPEFLGLPLLTFASLMFLPNVKEIREKKLITFFIFIGLVGVFLAKGTNEPFGFIYTFLFQTFPGFIMFRDPSKWYMLISISYSVLIPYAVYSLYKIVHKKIFIKVGLVCVLSLYFVYLLLPAFLGNLSGTFLKKEIPSEYQLLSQVLIQDQAFSRVLWIPSKNRFGFTSENHPGLNATDLFQTHEIKKILQKLSTNSTGKILSDGSVGYIVIPSDPLGEIFLTERVYDDSKRVGLINSLDKLPYEMQKIQIGRLTVYKFDESKPLFAGKDGKSISYIRSSPSHYVLEDVEEGTITFSNAFDVDWTAVTSSGTVLSQNNNGFNSFLLTSPSKTVTILYKPQQMVRIGAVVASLTFVGVVATLLYLRKFN